MQSHANHGVTNSLMVAWFNGLVVMISVLHTEGPEFDPQLNHAFLIFHFASLNSKLD